MKTAVNPSVTANSRRPAEQSSFQRSVFSILALPKSPFSPATPISPPSGPLKWLFQRHPAESTPLFPVSGLATGSLNGLHTKSKFLAFFTSFFARAVLLATAGIALLPEAHAQTIRIWSGPLTAGTHSWSTQSNWGGNVPNTNSEIADLRKNWTGAATINLSGDIPLNGIRFDDTGASDDVQVTIASRTLTLAGTNPSISTIGQLNISTILAGTGFAKVGSGTLNLTNVNTISGTVTVNAGTLRFVTRGLTSTSSIAVNGGTLEWAASNTDDLSARLALGAAGATLNTGANNVAFASGISAAGNLAKSGIGTLTLGAAGTVAGAVSVNAGKLLFNHSGAIDSAAVAIGADATVTLGFTPASALTLTNTFTGLGTLEIATTSETNLLTLENISGFNGTLAVGAGSSVNLAGSATAATIAFTGGTITNAANFTGNLNVSGGATLTTDGTVGGTVNLASGTTLAGNGTFTGTVNADSGSVISPGSSPGLTTYDELNLTSGSVIQLEFFSITENIEGVGRGYDAIAAKTLNFGNAGQVGGGTITLQLATLANLFDSVSDWNAANGITPLEGSSLIFGPGDLPHDFTIARFNETDPFRTLSDGLNVTSWITIDADLYEGTGANSFQVFVFAGDTTEWELQLRAIPEPSTYGLILGGLAGAAIRRRRKLAR